MVIVTYLLSSKAQFERIKIKFEIDFSAVEKILNSVPNFDALQFVCFLIRSGGLSGDTIHFFLASMDVDMEKPEYKKEKMFTDQVG